MSDTTTEAPEASGPVRFMQQHIALDYVLRVSPIAARFADGLERGVILGRRCPSCSRVYVPLRTFCPMCTVAIGVLLHARSRFDTRPYPQTVDARPGQADG